MQGYDFHELISQHGIVAVLEELRDAAKAKQDSTKRTDVVLSKYWAKVAERITYCLDAFREEY